ncbi:hypothetical protein P9112_010823 [Eukaryota sp. TZLM1-RC]
MFHSLSRDSPTPSGTPTASPSLETEVVVDASPTVPEDSPSPSTKSFSQKSLQYSPRVSPRNLRSSESKRIDQITDPALRSSLLRDLDACVRCGVTYGSESKQYKKRLHKLSSDITNAIDNQSKTPKPGNDSLPVSWLRVVVLLHFLVFFSPFFYHINVTCTNFFGYFIIISISISLLQLVTSLFVLISNSKTTALISFIFLILFFAGGTTFSVFVIIENCVALTFLNYVQIGLITTVFSLFESILLFVIF